MKTFLVLSTAIFLGVLFHHKLFWDIKIASKPLRVDVSQKENIYATPDFGRSEVWYLNYPLKDFLSASLKQGNLPFWNRNVGGGYPVFAEGQVGALFIPNLLVFYFFPTLQGFNISYVLIFITTFVGTYFFFLKNLKSQKIAFFCASTFSLSGFFVSHIPHFNLIQAASLLPWVFLSAQIFWENPSKLKFFILSVLLSQQVFAGHPQVSFMTTIGLFILFFILNYEKRPDFLLKGSLYLTFSVFFALGLSAGQILPSVELYQSSIRSKTEISELFRFPYKFEDLTTFVLPDYLGTPRKATYPSFDKGVGIYWENNAYVGFLPVILAVLSLFYIRKKSFVKKFLFLVFFSLILIFGVTSPYFFVYFFPLMSQFRVPSRFLVLAIFFLAGLSGLGLQWILESAALRFTKSGFARNLLFFCVLVLVIASLLKFGFDYNPVVESGLFFEKPETLSEIPKNKRVYTQKDQYYVWNKVFLTDGFRYPEKFVFFNNGLSPYLSLLFNRQNINAEESSPLLRQAILYKFPDSDLLSSFAVEYGISTLKFENSKFFSLEKEIEPPSPDLPKYYVYKSRSYIPRFRFVSNYEVKKFNYTDPSWDFEKSGLSFYNAALLEEDIFRDFENPTRSEIEILKDEDQEIILATKTDKESLLVMADSYYPGWSASINGENKELFAANINQRVLVVPSGNNLIKIYYFPKQFWYGVLVSLSLFYIFIFLDGGLFVLDNRNHFLKKTL